MVNKYNACKLVLRSWKDEKLHPLHLVADKIKWMSHHQEHDSPLVIALINKHKLSNQPRTEHLFSVVYLKNLPLLHLPVNENETAEETNLYCSEDFLENYQLCNEMCFTIIEPYVLDKIVLQALTQETYEWTHQKEFQRALMVASTCDQSILFRRGDTFLSEANTFYGNDKSYIYKRFSELVTISCTPWNQGVTTSKTSVIIINQQNCGQDFDVEKIFNKNEIFLTGNCFDFEVCDSFSEDEDSIVFISPKIASQLHLKNEDIVEMTLLWCPDVCSRSDLEETEDLEQRLVFVRVLEDRSQNVNDYCVHLPSTVWFNLNRNRKYISQKDCMIQIVKIEEEPIYAREVYFSLVSSPFYDQSVQFDDILVNYLKKPRLYEVGDVIRLNIKNNMEMTTNAKYLRCESIYYKVVGFAEAEKAASYLVDIQLTKLYQQGATKSFIPCSIIKVLPGLSDHLNQLNNIIHPYLHTNSFDHLCTLLISGKRGCGKRNLILSSCQHLNLHLISIDCFNLVSDSPGAGEARLMREFENALQFSPSVLLLNGIESLLKSYAPGVSGNGRMCSAFDQGLQLLQSQNKHPIDSVIFIATTNEVSSVDSHIRNSIVHQIDIKAPSQSQRHEIFSEMTSNISKSCDVDLNWLSKSTSGFSLSDICEVIRKTNSATMCRLISSSTIGKRLTCDEEHLICLSGFTTCKQDFQTALEMIQELKASCIGVPKIPKVSWEDIGGLEMVKSDILDTVQLPLDHPELISGGLNRSGVLLYGPPGTGKTLLAKAIASQCSLNFLSVKGPELINMYVGQSEENVRSIFSTARQAAPCVVFFDELDALAPNRGKNGDSGGVMDRIVSQLLAEIDGVNNIEDADKQVFVIAASNRPDLIDSSLLRPGRLDKLVYVGVSETKQDRLKILRAQIRKLNLSDEVDLDEVVEKCPPNLTGADFRGLVNEAAMNSIRRRIKEEKKTLDSGLKIQSASVVQQNDFLLAASNIQPSLQADQLENYKNIYKFMSK